MDRNELKLLKRQMLDKDNLEKEYLQYWGTAFRQMRNEANNHSEFPTSAKILEYVQGRIAEDSESYLKELPLQLEAYTNALIMLLIKNNQRILQMVETITESEKEG
jgi:hypothetical protein